MGSGDIGWSLGGLRRGLREPGVEPPDPNDKKDGFNFINLSRSLELGLESMRRAFDIIFEDNFRRRVFLEGSRGWRPVLLRVVLKAQHF